MFTLTPQIGFSITVVLKNHKPFNSDQDINQSTPGSLVSSPDLCQCSRMWQDQWEIAECSELGQGLTFETRDICVVPSIPRWWALSPVSPTTILEKWWLIALWRLVDNLGKRRVILDERLSLSGRQKIAVSGSPHFFDMRNFDSVKAQ